MERTRVLLVGLPRLLEEILTETVAAEDDLELAGIVGKPRSLAGKAARMRADVMIIGENDPAAVASLLTRQPHLKVLAVGGGGQDSWLYSLRPERIWTGNLSPKDLIAAVRRAAGEGTGADSWG